MLTSQTSYFASSLLVLENHSNIMPCSDSFPKWTLVLKSWEDFVYRSLFTGLQKEVHLLENQDLYFLIPMKKKCFIVRTHFITRSFTLTLVLEEQHMYALWPLVLQDQDVRVHTVHQSNLINWSVLAWCFFKLSTHWSGYDSVL